MQSAKIIKGGALEIPPLCLERSKLIDKMDNTPLRKFLLSNPSTGHARKKLTGINKKRRCYDETVAMEMSVIHLNNRYLHLKTEIKISRIMITIKYIQQILTVAERMVRQFYRRIKYHATVLVKILLSYPVQLFNQNNPFTHTKNHTATIKDYCGLSGFIAIMALVKKELPEPSSQDIYCTFAMYNY